VATLDRFVLPSDVVIRPVAQLPLELRGQVAYEPGNSVVSRPHSRLTSSIVDARTAALLETFRTPATIVDAVIAFSAAEGLDPRMTLDDAFPVLAGFVNQGLLVAAGSELALPVTTTVQPGDRVGGFEVVEPVHVIVDTEVYRARAADGSAVALKIARPGADEHLRAAFTHEAAILGLLDGRVSPSLVHTGALDGRPYLAMTWCAGVDVYRAGAEARGLGEAAGRPALLELAEKVSAAYAHLHAQGIVHGDVHPRNLLVGPDGTVVVIDFGLAGGPAAGAMSRTRQRGGIDLFLEPEVAAALLAGRRPPALSYAGEQYSLGALLYVLLTGAHTHAFSLEQDQMLHQLLQQPPLPFHHHGAWDMPAVEHTVRRTLAKEPGDRYQSISTFLRAFRTAAERDRRPVHTPARPPGSQTLLDGVVDRLAVPGALFAGGLVPPTASVMYGSAGLAYALLRIAGIRDDERLLAVADLWSTKALSESGSEDAFWNPDLRFVADTIGSNSFYHHATGLYCVQALVAHARGDERAQQLALESLVAAAAEPCAPADVVTGRAGLLLGCSLALESSPASLNTGPLRAIGDTLEDSLWSELVRQPALADDPKLRTLGIAHGWAGYLFALLRWSEAAATPPPAGLGERLEQLAALGRPISRGMCWPYEPGAPDPDSTLGASWCNGAAGYVQLWTLAHRQLREERFMQLAQMAAWSAYEGSSAAPGDLCCGLAGRAYALLCLHRSSGELAWLARAQRLADHAAAAILQPQRRDSLYTGEAGVALLAADLQAPEHARMPLFEAEGWPPRSASFRRASDGHRM
jgi:eukaryotic-like serine/threonine-protein kinase